MIIRQVSYASLMEQLSTGNIESNTKSFKCHHCREKFGIFWVKNHVLWAPMGFLDAGYPQVSGADQVIVSITSNLRVPIR